MNRDIAVIGNRIERPVGPAIVLHDVQAVRIANKTCTPAAPVIIGPLDRPQVKLEGNSGLVGPSKS